MVCLLHRATIINLFAALHRLYSFTRCTFIPRKLQDATGHEPLTWHL